MKEKPILFSGEMVRAILDGRKTQTRRVIKPQPKVQDDWYPSVCPPGGAIPDAWSFWDGPPHGQTCQSINRSPYSVGDRLWVKETWMETCDNITQEPNGQVLYQATYEGVEPYLVDGDGFVKWRKDGVQASPWRSPRFMPRWASRITLEVTEVRVQRLQEISDSDIEAEGLWPDGSWSIPMVEQAFANAEGVVASCGSLPMSPERYGFVAYWDSLNKKKHPWSSNPWVWAVTFKPCESHKAGEGA